MDHENTPWAVVIPGGQWQEGLVAYLTKQLYRVAVVNPFKTWLTDHVDRWIECDIMMVDEYAEQVKSLNPKLVITDQCDVALEPMRRLCDITGHPYHSTSVIENFRDKYMMFLHARNCGIVHPKTKLVRSQRDAFKAVLNEIDTPFVLKPTDNNASVGIQFVMDMGDSFDANEACRLSYRKTAIIQQFIEGRHLSVDGVVVNGKHHCLTVGERFYMRPAVIGRVNYTAEVPESVRNRMFNAVDRFVQWSGVEFGITHTEFILQNGIPYFCETALRGGGAGTSSHIVPWVSGYNPYHALVNGHLGLPADSPGEIQRRYASIKFFEFPSGTVTRFDDSNVKNMPGVAMWKPWVKEGDVLSPAKDGKSRHGCMIVLGDSPEDVDEKLKAAVAEVKIDVRNEVRQADPRPEAIVV
jgi:hypothetical protein